MWPDRQGGHTLRNVLFGAVRLVRNADISKYKYSRYGIGFDNHGTLSMPGGGFSKNFVTFGVDMIERYLNEKD